MSAKKVQKSGWPAKPVNPPKLSNTEWILSGVVGVILLVMAVLQLVGFADFRDALRDAGLSAPTAWAVGVIVAELWGAAGFFKIPLSPLFRLVSYGMAVLAASFWFVQTLQVAAGPYGHNLANSGFFGRFLAQPSSWWTVLEATVLLAWVIYKVQLLLDKEAATKRK